MALLPSKTWALGPKRKVVTADYDIVPHRVLGSGMFSTVRFGSEKGTGTPVAIKHCDKADAQALSHVRTETTLLRKISHPNIVSMRAVYETDTAVDIVLELCEGGQLLERSKGRALYSERAAVRLMRQLLTAVHYLHCLGVVHRDIKPENILFVSEDDESEIKLADFGIAKRLEGDGGMKTPCGSPGYIAPEIARLESYSKGVDVWAVGCILYAMLSGSSPFYDLDLNRMYEKIKVGSFAFPAQQWSHISEAAKDMITCLLRVDPSSRFTADQALKHPWITGEAYHGASYPCLMSGRDGTPGHVTVRDIDAEMELSLHVQRGSGPSEPPDVDVSADSGLWKRRQKRMEVKLDEAAATLAASTSFPDVPSAAASSSGSSSSSSLANSVPPPSQHPSGLSYATTPSGSLLSSSLGSGSTAPSSTTAVVPSTSLMASSSGGRSIGGGHSPPLPPPLPQVLDSLTQCHSPFHAVQGLDRSRCGHEGSVVRGGTGNGGSNSSSSSSSSSSSGSSSGSGRPGGGSAVRRPALLSAASSSPTLSTLSSASSSSSDPSSPPSPVSILPLGFVVSGRAHVGPGRSESSDSVASLSPNMHFQSLPSPPPSPTHHLSRSHSPTHPHHHHSHNSHS